MKHRSLSVSPRALARGFALLTTVFVLTGCTVTREGRIRENQAMFDKLPDSHKRLVLRGLITEGMRPDAVYLAWGRPSQVSKGSRSGRSFERWIYTRYEPVWSQNVGIGYGYGHGYGHGCRYGGFYGDGPQVTYIPYNAAKVEFVSGRVKAWEALR